MEWGYLVLGALTAMVITLSSAHEHSAATSSIERRLQQQPLIVRVLFGGVIGGTAITLLFGLVQHSWAWRGLWWSVGWVGSALIAHLILARRANTADTSE